MKYVESYKNLSKTEKLLREKEVKALVGTIYRDKPNEAMFWFSYKKILLLDKVVVNRRKRNAIMLHFSAWDEEADIEERYCYQEYISFERFKNTLNDNRLEIVGKFPIIRK
jgi:hypothetical protein